MKKRYGIIDIGSNTMRLVIYEKGRNGFYREVENTKMTARLREYLEEGVLTTTGVAVLLGILRQFQEITRYHGLEHVICVATATVRQAANQQQIIQLVETMTDFQLRVLSEYEEAYYGYLAVMNSSPFTEGITIDIGGGSTEITYFHNRKLLEYHSFPFGALSLRRQFVREEVPTDEEIAELQAYLTYEFGKLPWLQGRRLPVIAIGGSARNLAKVQQNRSGYPISALHLYEMRLQDVEETQEHMRSLSFAELQKLDGLAKDRADTIIPAAEVFGMLMHLTEAQSFVVSRKGLREGIFYEELLEPLGLPYYPSPSEESITFVMDEYQMQMDSVLQLIGNALAICEGLQGCGAAAFTEEDLQAVRRAAKVFNIGKYIDDEASSQHTFYLLANKTIDGMMHKERIQLALLASYRSKLSFKQYMAPFEKWFSKEEQRTLRLLGAILQLAAALDVTNRRIVQEVGIAKHGEHLAFSIQCRQHSLTEQLQAEKQKKQLEKILKCNLELNFHTIK